MARPKKVVEPVVVGDAAQVVPTVGGLEYVAKMNEYAARVWAGQSVDLTKDERIHRVKEALKNQGYSDKDLQDLRIENA